MTWSPGAHGVQYNRPDLDPGAHRQQPCLWILGRRIIQQQGWVVCLPGKPVVRTIPCGGGRGGIADVSAGVPGLGTTSYGGEGLPSPSADTVHVHTYKYIYIYINTYSKIIYICIRLHLETV